MSTPVSVRLSPETATKLEQLADLTERPKSWHFEQALVQYLDSQAWQVEGTKEALNSIAKGSYHSHEEAIAKMKAWDKKPRRRRRK